MAPQAERLRRHFLWRGALRSLDPGLIAADDACHLQALNPARGASLFCRASGLPVDVSEP
jgi:hypothetical protein